MSSVQAQFLNEQKSPKCRRVDAESITSYNLDRIQTHLILSHVQHSRSSEEGDCIVLIVEEESKEYVMELESSVNRVLHGSVSLIGRRRVMEDAITVAPPGLPRQYEFFAVYDGQGGPWVSAACHERLHLILANGILREGVETVMDWRRVMKTSFEKMDDVVKEFDLSLVEDGFDGVVRCPTTGSTATVVMVGAEEVVVANCGDSRAVLFSGGVVLPLSVDHKPNVRTEQMRLQNQVLDSLFDLPVSRSIGHHGHIMKQYIISDPDVNVHRRIQSDEFLIIATHGLWDVVSNEDACAVVKNCLNGQIKRCFEDNNPVNSPTVAATTLAEFAMARGSKDNISLVVLEL